jgi:hydantoinase/carbamoylase family amidase
MMQSKERSALRVRGARLQETITNLSKIGRATTGGISRFTFSKSDLIARAYVSKLIASSGMEVSVDDFGNIIGCTEASSRKPTAVVCGSHIDTVPNGGSLDGAYGVLSAIEVVRTIRESRVKIEHPLEIVVFTEEEGVRFPSFLGSRGFTGALLREKAYKFTDGHGITFEEALSEADLDPRKLRSFHKNPRKEIKCYIEAHIEQGPKLEHEGFNIGVVTSIVGVGDLNVTLRGRADHAGTTEMNLRRDALIGASHIITGTNRLARQTPGTVATVGSVRVSPNASNVVPGSVTLGIDVRAQTSRKLRLLEQRISDLSERIGRRYDLAPLIIRKSVAEPTPLSRKIIRIVTAVASSLGLSFTQMTSGAGHDCQNMAHVTDAGMIFVPSRRGASHSPAESTNAKDLENGANVLLHTVLRLASSRELPGAQSR